MRLDKNLREFIELLNSANVEYVVVGAHAVGFHGHPRQTGDIDFFLAINPQNAQSVMDVLVRFGLGSLGLVAADFLVPDTIVQIGYPPNRIDLITGISAVTFAEAWASRVESTIDGVPVHLISYDLLLRNKLASGRPKDSGDAHHLQKRANRPSQ
jgi:hypothetical protein